MGAESTVERRLLEKTARYLGRNPLVAETGIIGKFTADPKDLIQRIDYFDKVLKKLNRIPASDELRVAILQGFLDPSSYSYASNFRREIKREELDNLAILAIHDPPMTDGRCARTFGEASQLISKGEWRFLQAFKDDPNVALTGSLIGIYGIYVQKTYPHNENPDFPLTRQFIWAFKEVLENDFPNSPLTADVKALTKEAVGHVKEVTEEALQTLFGKDKKNEVVARFEVTPSNKGLSTDPAKVNPEIGHYLFNHSVAFSWEIDRNLQKMGLNAQVHTSASPASKEHHFVAVYDGIDEVLVDPTIGRLIAGHPQVFVGTRKQLFDLLGESVKATLATDDIKANRDDVFDKYWGPYSRS